MNPGLAAGLASDMVTETYARLEVLQRAAAGLLRPSREELERLRADMAVLVAGLRKLLAAHAADEHGRCPQCRGWLRRRRWPCRVWRSAHENLVTCDAVPRAQRAPVPPPDLGSGASTPAGRVPFPRARPAGVPTVRRRSVSGDRPQAGAR